VTVDFDDCRINHSVFHVGLLRDGVKYTFKNIGFDPMTEPFEDCVPVTKMLRQITPWAAGAGYPQNGFNE
jgi:hypothetical protein